MRAIIFTAVCFAVATACAATLALLWKFKKLPEPLIVAAAALIDLIVYPLVR